MNRGSLSSAEETRETLCTLLWKAASGFPCCRLKVGCFRLVTPAVEKFGEIAALDGEARTADATTLTRATIMVLARSSLKRLIETRPQLAQAAVDLLCRKLRRTSEQIEAIALHSTQVRLARFLLAAIAMKGQGEANSGPVVVDLGMSQTELGLLLGASRSKVNEALATLEKLGAARHTGRHIECNVSALQDIAQGD